MKKRDGLKHRVFGRFSALSSSFIALGIGGTHSARAGNMDTKGKAGVIYGHARIHPLEGTRREILRGWAKGMGEWESGAREKEKQSKIDRSSQLTLGARWDPSCCGFFFRSAVVAVVVFGLLLSLSPTSRLSALRCSYSFYFFSWIIGRYLFCSLACVTRCRILYPISFITVVWLPLHFSRERAISAEYIGRVVSLTR